MKNFVLVGLRPIGVTARCPAALPQPKHGKTCTLPHITCAVSVKLLKRRKIILLLYLILYLSVTKNKILEEIALLCANPSKLQLI